MDDKSRHLKGLQPKPKSTVLVKTIIISIFFLGAVVWWVARGLKRPDELVPGTTTVKKAVVILQGDSNVTGKVIFTQSSSSVPVSISGEIKGLDPKAKRGFHIHSLGDLTSGCISTGSHYNPLQKNHGSPSSNDRHVGDLGNIESDANGLANFELSDRIITLNGPFSIIGRAVVVHAGTDDLGKGGDDESLKTGNAGGRAACGIIGLSE